MGYIFQNIHWFLLLLGPLIFFHELGHFLVAKACGVKVLRFSLGFGPKLLGFRRGDTEYLICALPLGGYVKMLGDVPGQDVPPEEASRAFNNRPVWQRSLIIFAGPFANLLLAFVAYYVMSVGQQTFDDARLGIITRDEPAWNAGLRPGDRVENIDGEPIDDWDEFAKIVGSKPGLPLRMVYQRDGKESAVEVTPIARPGQNEFQEVVKVGRIGVSPHFIEPILAIVDHDSPASKAGLRSGDVVKEVNGRSVAAWHEVRGLVTATPAGTPVRLTVKRADETKTFEVVPSEAPPEIDLALSSGADPAGAYIGLVAKEALVHEVTPSTPAADLGLIPGDRPVRLRIDRGDQGVIDRPIGSFSIDFRAALETNDARSAFTLTWQRGRTVLEKPFSLVVKEELDELKNKRKTVQFGALNDATTIGRYTFERTIGLGEAVVRASARLRDVSVLLTLGVVKLFQARIPLDSMGGPIMLFVLAEKSAGLGFGTFVDLLALVSVNLAILNLLPIPVLDGGHLMFCLVEAVRRRPPSVRFREVASMVGLALLLLLMVVIFKNDLLRYVFG